VIRTFCSPPTADNVGQGEAPVHVLSLLPDDYPGDGAQDDALLGELMQDGRAASRILVDIATASREVTKRPTVLVPPGYEFTMQRSIARSLHD
jgi:hypothetical protein